MNAHLASLNPLHAATPPDIELESKPCPLNCPPGDKKILTGRDRLHDLPGEFTILKCKTCGLLRTNPRPTQGSMGFYYPESYSPWAVPGDRPASTKPLPVWKRAVKRLLMGKPIERTPAIPPGRLLEIGCGSGAYLHTMENLGWEVEGIEISSQAGSLAQKNGLKVHIGPLETAPDPREPYDMIVGWHTLEHLHDPVRVLKSMLGWLKEGGVLVLGMPNAASLEFHLFKTNWYALQLPTHLYHFTPGTLGRLLSEAGWEVTKVLHERNISNLMVSTGYLLGEHLGNKSSLVQYFLNYPKTYSRWRMLLKPVERLLAYTGQTGRMIVWARKKGLDR